MQAVGRDKGEALNVPLKIEFRMETPICLTYPFIFFDAVIAHLMNRLVDPEGYRELPSKRVVKKASDIKIPIKKLQIGCKWIYHASVSVFDVNEASVTTIYKRFCERFFDFQKARTKRIDRNRGFFKDHAIKLVYLPAQRIIFYVNGNPDVLELLLDNLPALGKKTSIGFGFIKDYSIREMKEDWSIIKDGKAMRPIPIEFVRNSEEIVLMAWKPPYWAKENVSPCVPPFARCSLCTQSGESSS